MLNIVSLVSAILIGALIGAFIGVCADAFFGNTANKNVNTYVNTSAYTYSNSSANTSGHADSADRELQSVLNKIAGTYELTENLGIYGFRTVYTVKINRDGTGMFVSDNGHIENYFGARLSGSNKIVFSGNYGGSVYLLSGPGIEDESANKERTEIGTPKYIMRKR